MANANVAFGLKPIRHAMSAGYNDGTDRYFVPASDVTPLYIGDPVILAGSADANGVPTVTRAGATGLITGVVVGFSIDRTIVTNGYRAASTDCYVLVEHDPDALYEVQENGAMTAADAGLNANLVAGNGNPYTRKSGFMLDSSTKAVTAGLQVRLVGLVQRPDNAFGTNANWLVRINQTTETAAAGSTGIA
jgi:hypothetical protein